LKCRMLEEGKRWIRKEIQQGTHGRPPADHPDHEHRSCDWASVGCAAVPSWRAEQSSMVQWTIYTAARIKREARRSASCVGFRNLFKHRQFSVRQRFQAISYWRQRVFCCKAVMRSGYRGAYPGALHCPGQQFALAAGRTYHCPCKVCCDTGFEHPQSHIRETFQAVIDRIGSQVLRAYVKVPARRRVQALQGIQIWRQQQAAHSVTTLDIRTLFKHRIQQFKKNFRVSKERLAMLLAILQSY
jgi:hypothetical protein